MKTLIMGCLVTVRRIVVEDAEVEDMIQGFPFTSIHWTCFGNTSILSEFWEVLYAAHGSGDH
jgi:hypothetical protein